MIEHLTHQTPILLTSAFGLMSGVACSLVQAGAAGPQTPAAKPELPPWLREPNGTWQRLNYLRITDRRWAHPVKIDRPEEMPSPESRPDNTAFSLAHIAPDWRTPNLGQIDPMANASYYRIKSAAIYGRLNRRPVSFSRLEELLSWAVGQPVVAVTRSGDLDRIPLFHASDPSLISTLYFICRDSHGFGHLYATRSTIFTGIADEEPIYYGGLTMYSASQKVVLESAFVNNGKNLPENQRERTAAVLKFLKHLLPSVKFEEAERAIR